MPGTAVWSSRSSHVTSTPAGASSGCRSSGASSSVFCLSAVSVEPNSQSPWMSDSDSRLSGIEWAVPSLSWAAWAPA
ncbi:hypothetical protein [Nonomuraea gerenzanensis]|uniref:hypothetical protein n=1 Tax=Nonomuraea gerenzanensis TaxID=93944 RepID=UPI001CD98C73|nr:hypothetical protein [Nonomuraea gerenzanensis]UBU18152.1 hypothetical protein LCN96_24940 [Nonomuraea gerenzanensis]